MRRLIPLLAALWLTIGALAAMPGAEQPLEPIVRTATDGEVRLTVELDQRTLWIDDPLHLAVRVEAPSDHTVELPELADDLGRLLVAGQRSQEPATASGTTTWERVYVLEPEAVGELTVPPVAITWRRDAGGAPEHLRTNAMVVTVRSVMPEDASILDPKGIAPPVELSTSGAPAWPLIAAVALALVVTSWLVRRRRARPAARARPAHLVALDLLERLRREGLLERGRIEEFYTRLSAILRQYAAWRFGLPARAWTTEEVLAAVDRLDAPIGAHRTWLAVLLGDSDLVKFARRRPAAPRMTAALDAAREMIERTADPDVLVSETAALPAGDGPRPA